MKMFRQSFDAMEKAVERGDRETLREMMRTSTLRRGWFDR